MAINDERTEHMRELERKILADLATVLDAQVDMLSRRENLPYRLLVLRLLAHEEARLMDVWRVVRLDVETGRAAGDL